MHGFWGVWQEMAAHGSHSSVPAANLNQQPLKRAEVHWCRHESGQEFFAVFDVQEISGHSTAVVSGLPISAFTGI